jgi:hypothetical protein
VDRDAPPHRHVRPRQVWGSPSWGTEPEKVTLTATAA